MCSIFFLSFAVFFAKTPIGITGAKEICKYCVDAFGHLSKMPVSHTEQVKQKTNV